jgi:hypothetical protein
VRAGKAVLTDAEYRSILLLRIFNRENLHQTTALTAMDRYPRIFSACRDFFGDRQDLKILSFGCSTGEEVLTLRRYFPSAFITGAEINRRSLASCWKRNVDDRIAFVYSDRETIPRHGPFDAIFCMAVLQRTPMSIEDDHITSLKRIYPFEKFDRQVSELDLLLKKNGLFVVHHTPYQFSEASVAANYLPLANHLPLERAGPGARDFRRFDRNSERLERAVSGGSIFIKMKE